MENEQLSEFKLKKEIRTTIQRLLEIIKKKKNQLIVHRIKEKQQQEQLNSNNHMNDLPQPPPFGPFINPASFFGDKIHGNLQQLQPQQQNQKQQLQIQQQFQQQEQQLPEFSQNTHKSNY